MTQEKTRTEQINVVLPEKQAILVRIEGISPLVVKQFGLKAKMELEDKHTGRKKENTKKRIRKPEEEFKESRYISAEGHDCVPAIWFKKGMTDAGYRYMGLTQADLKQDLFVRGAEKSADPDAGEELALLVLDAPEPQQRRDYVRNSGMGRTADLRYRAEYSPWALEIPIEFFKTRLTAEQVVQMLAYMGEGAGIGEMRPQKSGNQFGRFQVVGVEPIE